MLSFQHMINLKKPSVINETLLVLNLQFGSILSYREYGLSGVWRCIPCRWHPSYWCPWERWGGAACVWKHNQFERAAFRTLSSHARVTGAVTLASPTWNFMCRRARRLEPLLKLYIRLGFFSLPLSQVTWSAFTSTQQEKMGPLGPTGCVHP